MPLIILILFLTLSSTSHAEQEKLLDSCSYFVLSGDDGSEKILHCKSYPAIESISSNLEGSDVKYIYRLLDKDLMKDQYETNQEYQDRLKKSYETKYKTKKWINDYVILKNKGRSYNRLKYDPVNQWYYFDYPSRLRVDTSQFVMDEYIGENAFGIQRGVSKVLEGNYFVNFTNKSDFPDKQYEVSDEAESNYYSKKVDVIFEMPPKQAKESKDDLYFLYIAKSEYPYREVDGKYSSPTIHTPQETISTYSTVILKLHGLAVYNNKTGEILFHKKLMK